MRRKDAKANGTGSAQAGAPDTQAVLAAILAAMSAHKSAGKPAAETAPAPDPALEVDRPAHREQAIADCRDAMGQYSRLDGNGPDGGPGVWLYVPLPVGQGWAPKSGREGRVLASSGGFVRLPQIGGRVSLSIIE
jgi:hypothetical protein